MAENDPRPPSGRLSWLREVPAQRAAAFVVIALVALAGLGAIFEAFPLLAALVIGLLEQLGALPPDFLG